MKTSNRSFASRVAVGLFAAATGVVTPLSALAGQGLTASAGEWLWPQFQARITVQTAAIAPIALTRLFEPGALNARGVQGGSLLGDYIFATPGFGNFRATSGVMLGGTGGAPVLSATPMSRLGVTVLDSGVTNYGLGMEGPATLPYVGLGYSSASLWRSVSVSADLGLVAGRPAGLSGLGRLMLGSQGVDAAMRDMRVAPVLQLGVRYSF